MNEELIIKLKNVGFPDPTIGIRLSMNILASPTLSQLIKECGNPYFKAKMNQGRWFVIFPELEDEGGNQQEFWLDSLKEVFAMLWLELNKK